jgi:sec-independent protein translocase protein TatB
MFDMSWGEVMVIGAVALIVIGPKDLPKALRTAGQVVGKVRRLAAEFQGQFAEAMREAELDEVKRQMQGVNDSVSTFNPAQTIRNELKSAIEAPVAEGPKPDSVSAEASPLATDPTPHLPPLPAVDAPAALSVAFDEPHTLTEPEPAPSVLPAEKPTEKAS